MKLGRSLRRPIAPCLALLAVTMAGSAQAGSSRVIDRVVAVVNDEIVLDSELDQWTLMQVRGQTDLSTKDGRKAWREQKRKALDQMIEKRLVMQQAQELKLTVTAEEVDRGIEEIKGRYKLDDAAWAEALKEQGFTPEAFRKDMRRQILEQKVMNTAVRSRISVSDEELRAYYQQNARQMSTERSARLRYILIALAPGSTGAEIEAAQKTASRVLELRRAGNDFAELARTYSDDAASKAAGGEMGWVEAGALEEPLERAVESMDPGEVRGPIRSSRGFGVIEVVERKEGDLRPFDEVKEQLRQQLYMEQLEKAAGSWVKELRKRAHVDVRF